ncbi:similar to Saccharomyces cerevisiae YJR034W PET191 Protein required for assembly of cytochrome c oxidase [Geotrichum candidum]|uniref:Similar to Saccharomyces cerevisiae YJR034W PET191 Protein required for assembly of cytochrome c oxidase n=1 Tax=Geotrichum candidum TaxID=1173061 RepID=A0A0J9X492_GEOCN|nr:similar to Saccharomyces cerevisiae YJR034W PET191 Protein required for assembly of cytochrome c oxidase [Geotrichum candidum]
MPSSCKDLRNQVAICLQRSPCVLIDRNTPKQCVENEELRKELPEKCRLQLASFYKCKHGLVDMTKRFRGNAPLSTGRYDKDLAKLSSGDFNAEDEQAKLAISVPKN